MTDTEPDDLLLSVSCITKRFPGVLALDDVTWSLRAGEVHVLVGENGAGKSSLVKTLCGIYAPDSGTMQLGGAPFAPAGPHDALKAGIRVVYQELNLLPHLDVAENLTLEQPPQRFGMVDRREQRRRARELMAQVGLDIPTSTLVGQLGIAQMQLLEIAKALATDSRLLILDEPTATLTSTEVNSLFAVIRRLSARGVTIVYISHHLEEIFEIGDRVTVMRNGAIAATRQLSEVTVPDLVRLMVGRELSYTDLTPPTLAPDAAELLRVEDLRPRGASDPISFRLRSGEVLGIAGLVGSGRTEAMRALFGADPKDSGRVWLRGTEVRIRSPRDAVEAGICLLTEDRKAQGLMLEMSCAANTSITNLRAVSRGPVLLRAAERQAAERFRTDLRIRTPSVGAAVSGLSGGNQQKFVLAKWLFRDAAVLIVDEPTRGIDVGAKFEIYTLLHQLAAEGRGLIVVSSDLPELFLLSHRIAVLSRGRVAGVLERRDFSAEAVLNLAYQAYTSSNDLEVAP